MRKFTVNRWNWSQKAGKWVFVTTEGGKRKYEYRVEAPKEFVDLTMEMKKLSDKQAKTEDPEENMKLFKELMEISRRMQQMRHEE